MTTNIISNAVFNPLIEADVDYLGLLLYRAAQNMGLEPAGVGIADDAMKEKYRQYATEFMRLAVTLKPQADVLRGFILKGSDVPTKTYEPYAYPTYEELGIEKLDAF